MTRRAVMIAGGALLLSLFGSYAVRGQGRDPLSARGQQLFLDHGCFGCHTIGAVGTPLAPDLTRVGATHTVASLAAWLRDPASQKPTAHMPKIELSEADVRALAAYLASLR